MHAPEMSIHDFSTACARAGISQRMPVHWAALYVMFLGWTREKAARQQHVSISTLDRTLRRIRVASNNLLPPLSKSNRPKP